jgi:hypothetical protein
MEEDGQPVSIVARDQTRCRSCITALFCEVAMHLAIRRYQMRYLLSLLFFLFLAAGPVRLSAQSIAEETSFRVKLMTRLSTETNDKGDKLTAIILQPPAFAKAFMEGEVKESKARGGLFQKTSVLNISFLRIMKQNKAIEVDCKVKEIYNSKGEINTDDENRVIENKSSGKKSADAGQFLPKLETQGSQLSFAAGTELVLTVRTKQASTKNKK